MPIITLNHLDLIESYQNIAKKHISNTLSLKDIISLVFHAITKLSENSKDWNNIHNEFLADLEKQNIIGWPVIAIIRNDFCKRIDVIVESSFAKTSNILLILLRILYIETYKQQYFYNSYNYHEVMTYIEDIMYDNLGKISINDLFGLLTSYMRYYVKIYNDEEMIENKLGERVLDMIKID